jgi:putative peptide zinc metalloprotease protein
MDKPTPASDLERRKQVKIRLRCDLDIAPQKYEGKTFFVVKDPVSLRYYRFKDQEHFLLQFMDGRHTLDDAQKAFEKRFRPDRLTLEDLEQFAQQLLTAGLAQNESPQAGKQLFDRRKKRRRSELLQTLTNILYIKIPVFDPDKLLTWMLKQPFGWGWTRLIFTIPFLLISVAFMMSAIVLVATHFETFRDKLPSYHEFFSFKTVAYLWVALGVVKIIHEFGHGLSCKAFKGEVHEMGLLFLCLSPCLYCNVSDAWTLPNKWKRIIISGAGIYVELIIAAAATWVWWNTPSQPFINNLSLSLMIVCSVSTVVFNANPLMRYDGYYVLLDWLEIPNLRDRSNRFLQNVVLEHCLGIEVQPEPYMALGRKVLFIGYAIVSWIYRWVVTFSILFMLSRFLGPKLRVISELMTLFAAGSLAGWPLFRLGKNLYKRGRLPDMKSIRVAVSASVVGAAVLFFFLVPLQVSRIRQLALVQVVPDPETSRKVFLNVPYPSILEELKVQDGQTVVKGQELARFSSRELQQELLEAFTQYKIREDELKAIPAQLNLLKDQQEIARVRLTEAQLQGDRDTYQAKYQRLAAMEKDLVLKAPMNGVVMNSPVIDDVGKLWDKSAETPFCAVGNPDHLEAVMPLDPSDMALLTEDMRYMADRHQELDVTIRVQGRDVKTWKGRLDPNRLPESDAREVPPQLTAKLGGPLAVKPPSKAGQFVPQSQVYLVRVQFVNPDKAIYPGTLAQVKVHCRWRSTAWWVYRLINTTFHLRLM